MITYIAIGILAFLLIACIGIILYMKLFAKDTECPVCLDCAQKCISHCSGGNTDLSMCKLCLLSECAKE